MTDLINDIDNLLNNIITIGIHIVDGNIIHEDTITLCHEYNLLYLENELVKLKENLNTKENVPEITLIICTLSESIRILNQKINYDLVLQ